MSPHDSLMLVETAAAFTRAAAHLTVEETAITEHPMERECRKIAVETNACYALELLFMALAYMQGREPKKGHRLLVLWNDLPRKIRAQLEYEFDRWSGVPVVQTVQVTSDKMELPRAAERHTQAVVNKPGSLPEWLQYFDHHHWWSRKYDGRNDPKSPRHHMDMPWFINMLNAVVIQIRKERGITSPSPNAKLWVVEGPTKRRKPGGRKPQLPPRDDP